MQEQISQRVENFEYIKPPEYNEFVIRNIGETAIKLANISIDLSRIERLPRYDLETRENDAEHSFMLSLIALELAPTYFPELNLGKVLSYCIVHDLPEKITGDTVTFKISQEELNEKYINDRRATNILCSELPSNSSQILGEYEKQAEPEARFVRLLDKLMGPIVDIVGEGSKVMHEDRGVYSHEDLLEAERELMERFRIMFPEKELEILHQVKDYLVKKFYNSFQPKITENIKSSCSMALVGLLREG